MVPKGGYTDTVKLLLDNGADVNAEDCHGSTALIAAAVGGHNDTIRSLLSKGANINITTNDGGYTALDNALIMKQYGTAKLLRNAGGKTRIELMRDVFFN